jgi:hypothetical protein
MIRKLVASTFFVFILQILIAQQIVTTGDSIAGYFNEIKIATKKHTQLWNKNLYGPVLLVDPATRTVYANVPDSAGILQSNGPVYSGTLPRNINIANTAIHWNGKDWAMILLPHLPETRQGRINLMAHELFHKAQPSLGFKPQDPINNHLNEKEGRVYLRLELEALKMALTSITDSAIIKNIRNALCFRKFRYSIYPAADSTENMLELNEGLAEFTGAMMRGDNRIQLIEHFKQNIDSFLTNPTFVRSFVYQTTPVYGYLLYTRKKYWNKDINAGSHLTDYFIKAFKISFPSDLKKWVPALMDQYNGSAIIDEETKREERTKQLLAEYKYKFIEQSHFEIRFEKMNISFDPRNMIPIDDKGTVYPTIRVTDKWGILEVSDGALISAQWDKISVTNPTSLEGKNIKGPGWVLTLNEGYVVEKDLDGNYKLFKK